MWPSERTNSLVMHAKLLLREDEEFSMWVRRSRALYGLKTKKKKEIVLELNQLAREKKLWVILFSALFFSLFYLN